MSLRLAITVAVVGILTQGTLAAAQGVGSKVEVSPYALNSQWFPGTVISRTPGGDYTVQLDPREGYGDNEIYTVQKKWVRGAAAAPVQQDHHGGDLKGVGDNRGTGGGGGLKIGDLVSASPFSLKDQWYTGQIIGFQNGNPMVRITRPGMNRAEDYVIMPNWVKAAAGALAGALGANGAQMPQLQGALPNMGAAPIAGNPPAFQPPAVNNAGPIKVGDRVRYSPQFSKDERTWITGTVTSADGAGNFEVKSDPTGPLGNSVWHSVRHDFIKKDNSAAPQIAGPGNFPTTNKPIPGHETPVLDAADCKPNIARYKEILEDHHRYNYGIDYDQVDVAWDSFAIGRARDDQRAAFGAREMYQADASYRIKAVRKYTQMGKNYVKTVVYQYAKPILLFYVNDAGRCVFGGVDKSAGKLIYDQTNEVAKVEFDAIHKVVYAKPVQLGCACHRS